MLEKHFRVEINDWNKYYRVLRKTAPEVITIFDESELADNFSKWYFLSMPKERESPIHFLLRNSIKSSSTNSPFHYKNLMAIYSTAFFGWYMDKIPILRKVIRLNGASTELYLGQETKCYVSDEKSSKGEGIGNDKTSIIISNLSTPMNLNIDVGFKDDGKKLWFYEINVFKENLFDYAERAHSILQNEKER